MVRAPQETDRAFVTDTTTHKNGYLGTRDAVQTERPDLVDSDPLLARLEGGPEASPAVAGANRLLRAVTWLVFVGVGLFAAWRSTSPRHLAIYATVVFLATYWLVLGWFWPWYLIWALAPATLVSDTGSARLAVLLSATVLSLYILTGLDEWAYHYRSLPAFILPLLLFPLSYLPRAILRRGR